MTDRLNPEALDQQALEAGDAAAKDELWGRLNGGYISDEEVERAATAAVSAYLAALPATRTITGEQVNRAGWTCYGIHEPGNYATCEECREACDDLANFYNNMHHNPVATKTWTGQPTEGGGE